MIVLASSSPRRREILSEILPGEFIVVPSSFSERSIHEKDVGKLCLCEALGKGMDVSRKRIGDLIISADTMVSFKGVQLGKPKDEQEAFKILKELTGDVHTVVTAYCLIKSQIVLKKRIVRARLKLEKMSDWEIEEYIKTGSPLDKAGAYGIQDKDFIEAKILEGDYYTIMGLPKEELRADLEEIGVL